MLLLDIYTYRILQMVLSLPDDLPVSQFSDWLSCRLDRLTIHRLVISGQFANNHI